MNDCTRCGKCFRDKYNLGRHISRTKPCKPIDINENNVILNDIDVKSTSPGVKSTKSSAKGTLPCVKDISECVKSICCEFCFQSFSNNRNKKNHNCKSKDDPIRQLEIELEITPVIPECKTECRFCNKVLSRITILNRHNCKQREHYHQKLLKQKEKQPVNTVINNFNNVTNITNITNQLNIVLDKEIISQDDIQCMIKAMEHNIKNFEGNTVDFDQLRMVDLVSKFHRIIDSHPENKNILLGSTQYSACKFRIEDGTYIKRPTEEVVDEAFRVRSGQLFKMGKSIHEQNPEVLKEKRIKRSWGNLKEFKEKGFKAMDNNRRQAKTMFKVAMVN